MNKIYLVYTTIAIMVACHWNSTGVADGYLPTRFRTETSYSGDNKQACEFVYHQAMEQYWQLQPFGADSNRMVIMVDTLSYYPQ